MALDEELLKGGYILSEWCALMVRESDVAFAKGAFLASIIAAVSAIETHLRSECQTGKTLYQLIDNSEIDKDLADEINIIRRFRNKFVHVDSPWNDQDLLTNEQLVAKDIENMAFRAARALRRTLYYYPLV